MLNGSTVTPGGTATLTSEWSPQTQFLPTLSAAAAYAFDAAHAGDLYPNGNGTFGRDSVDAQIVGQVLSYGTSGSILNEQDDDGLTNDGFGTLTNSSSPANSLDTVPFSWLTTHGLSTTNAAGLMLLNPLGYRMIEEYAQQVQDQYATQNASTGDWTTTTWTTATPGLYDHAQIRGTGTTNGSVTLAGTDAAQAFTVSVGGNGPAAGESLAVAGGTLTVQDTIYLGDQNNGTFNLSGGTVRAANLQLGNTVYDAAGNASSYTGTFNFTGGTLQVGRVVLGAGTPGTYTAGGAWNWNGGTLQAFGTLTVNAPATLSGAGGTVNTVGPDGLTYAATMSGVLGGTGGLTKAGAGVLTLAAVNAYSGPTNIAAGSIAATVTNAVPPGSTIDITGSGALLQLANGVTISSPIVVGGGTASEFADAPNAANATLAGPISLSGTAQFRVGDSGTGTLTFTGAGTSTSNFTFLTKGNVAYAAGGSLTETSASGGVTVGRSATEAVALTVTGVGSAVNVTKVAAGGAGLTLGSGSTSYENPTVTVTVTTGGAINVGPATVNLDADPTPATGTIATLNLVSAGTLTAGAFTDGEAGVNAAALNLNGGTLVAGGNDPAGGTFLPAFTGLTANVGSGGAIVNSAGFAVTVAQPLVTGVTSGTDGGLTKLGAGTVTLTGANTYNGKTTVSAGALRVNNAAGSGTGTGAINVSGGATLGGSGSVTGAVMVSGTIAAGASNTATGTFTTGAEAWNPGGSLAAKLATTDGATVSGSDLLVMSSLATSALTSAGAFAVTVTTVGTGTPVVPAGTVIVLANDKDAAAATDPFSSSAVLSKLSLSVTGAQSATGGFTLASQADTLGNGGYDLVLEDAAAPEPTGLLLSAVAAAPLALGRRRRRPS